MKKLNNYVLSLIVSVAAVFSIIAASVLGFAEKAALNGEFYTDIVRKEKIGALVTESIEEYFDNSSASSGIPAEIYMNAIDVDGMENAICWKITQTFCEIREECQSKYNGYDIAVLEQNITDYFEKFAEENNVEINESYNEQLKRTIETAEAEIESYSDIFMTEFMRNSNVISKAAKVYKLIRPAFIGTAAVFILCIVLLAVFNRKNISGLFYWLFVSGLCASVIVAVPCMILKYTDYFSGLVISTKYIYVSVTETLNAMLDLMISVQSCIFAAAVVLLVVYVLTGREKKKNGGTAASE